MAGTTLATVAAVAAIGGTAYSAYQTQRAGKAQRRAQAARQRQQELQARRSRRQAIRRQQVARAQSIATAQSAGGLGGSGTAGGIASLSSRTGSELGFSTQMGNLSGVVTQASMDASRASGLADIGGTIGGLGIKLGGLDFLMPGNQQQGSVPDYTGIA